jgi:hypothetical protein
MELLMKKGIWLTKLFTVPDIKELLSTRMTAWHTENSLT